MRVTDFISTVFDQIKREDDSAEVATRAKALRATNSILGSVTRKIIQQGEGYYRTRLQLLGTDARQIQRNQWEYTLPPWVARVFEVRHDKPAGEPEGYRISTANPRDRTKQGFYFRNRTTLILSGWTTAQDLRVEVAKVPAEVTDEAVVVLSDGTSASTLFVALSQLGNRASGYYINSIFEFSTALATSVSMAGYTMQVSDSQIVADSGFQRVELTNPEDFPIAPATSDEIFMHLELGDEHLRMLTLRVARQILQAEGNMDAIGAFAEELRAEERDFIDSLQRQQAEPSFIREGSDRVGARRANRDLDNFYYLG